MGPEALAQVLRPLEGLFDAAQYPNMLIGLDVADDAAVWRVSADEALVVTTDFFTPIVDDPYEYGAIAAANAMSDVFAMGGEVLFALNLLAFPDVLPPELVAEVVRGGAETVRAAGGAVVGGHSIVDREPKYGLCVVGRAHPDRLLRKGGARPGDVLLLTKPIGTGLITTALKRDLVTQAQIEAAVTSMLRLNRAAGRAAVEAGARAATDVTGFGLAGHALEMANAGCTGLSIELGRLPLLPGAFDHARDGTVPAGTMRNEAAYIASISGLDRIADRDAWAAVLFDPQTSGGLLIAVDAAGAKRIAVQLKAAGEPPPAVIGAVVEGAGLEVVGP